MTEYRSGFASIVGRPNAGKSTLVNAMVGAKVAITSDRPQTTRRIIRGIVTNSEGQLILVDTPGLHRPRTLLGERLNDQVHEALASVDVIGFCMPADQEVGAGDRFIAAAYEPIRNGCRHCSARSPPRTKIFRNNSNSRFLSDTKRKIEILSVFKSLVIIAHLVENTSTEHYRRMHEGVRGSHASN